MAQLDSTKINDLLASVTSPSGGNVPGVVFQAVDKNGNIIASGTSGVRNKDEAQPMTTDTVFWIASCTKLVTSIALMQLVEQGKANLDDADVVAKVLPEVAAAKVFQDGVYKEQEERITLRLLVTHTAGFSYTFLWEDYWKSIGEDESKDEFSGTLAALVQPLKNQPGKGREYSIGIDWVGVFIERTTGLSLGEYCEQNIFKPLGLESTAFVPSDSMHSRLASMHQRSEDGSITVRKHPLRIVEDPSVAEGWFHSGGGGLFSTAPDYCKILATIMNDGASPITSSRILSKATVDQMFTNQIPDWEAKYATRGETVCRFDLGSKILNEPKVVQEKQGWGLSFLLSGSNLETGSAPGISNCFWVLNREKGVGGVLFTQVLPLVDLPVAGLWMGLLAAMYS